jgi:hypothetical protein
MAKVTIRLGNPEILDVEVTIRATLQELRQFTDNNKPSHAVGHRLHEAIHAARVTLETVHEQEISRE